MPGIIFLTVKTVHKAIAYLKIVYLFKSRRWLAKAPAGKQAKQKQKVVVFHSLKVENALSRNCHKFFSFSHKSGSLLITATCLANVRASTTG